MKKSSLVMILVLVGCHSGKQVKPAITLTDSSITTSGTIEHFSSGIHQKCPDKGCDDPEFYKDDYINNPSSPGNAAVILPAKPAKKPKAHKQSRWSVTINEVTGHTTISDPKHELRCDYGGPLDPYALSALFTITCWKFVEKAK